MAAKEGEFRVECVNNVHYVTHLFCKYPLKLLSLNTKLDFAILYVLSYGGGLVSGDQVALKIHLGKDATLCIQTQGSTKVYKETRVGRITRQLMDVHVSANATCLLLQDPVQPFGSSNYMQTQNFVLEDTTSSLALLDWTIQGRSHMGERWTMKSYISKNIIKRGFDEEGNLSVLLRDTLQLINEPTLHIGSKADRMNNFECAGSLYLVGPKFEEAKKGILNHYRNKESRMGKTTSLLEQNNTFWTACELRSVTIIKFASYSTEKAREFLLHLFGDFAPEIHREALRAFWY
ncbi:urease accessory protein UreD [Schizosaccharomyces cryophilus OY26]|uniref:Urease accessory protein UreD n=1 Tax=Schizosaccharomyces cryophilus (strain OY26 / ATCC MYA-4695 / CBS 11777 / NBRC 106824 / NRRL Y48691) TaxID=653667 RepID=S9VYQ8_SCHCR|nr:urease accessory protein UreD [Schizosaccharomyces cryophilus OY26]EPY50955.1 urease accessory protein UreD [Schizosaccharomyces cryophilus OY26]